ncbi:MAG: ATP-binding protein, partial [Alphaproteobacteria bacterium]
MDGNIGQWLEGLGLGRYAGAFAENEITFDALPHLTQDDLKELGLPMGPRRIVSVAIGQLAGPAAPTSPVSAGKSSGQRVEAERRQLTVMFCDLVGSTALSTRLDPEEMRDIILNYQKAVTAAVNRFDGHVAKYMGDGVLAYFGFPAAHEDDAERAARAGLSIVQVMRGMRTPGGEPLMVRVGIATGLVVVGDLIGEGAAQEEAVVGDTPNLAARLQGFAEPGQVVIAESTRWLLADLFELKDLGHQALKGIAAPVTAFAVLAERVIESRFDARRSGQLGAIVGRDQELALLTERWRQAKTGEGQLVLLSGEAGIGKSRITRGLIDTVAAGEHIRISYQCSPYHADSALYPAIQQLNRAAGFTQEDTLETKLDKLERLLGQAATYPTDVAPIIATLLGLDGVARYGALALTPQQLRARTLSTLCDQLTGLADKRPVLFIVEDAHWIDPTTLEFLDQCLDRIAGAPILTLVTARPVFQHSFGGHPIVTRLTLNRLGHEQTAAIVAKITGVKTLPPELLAEITAKTDGIPLFVEELTKTVLESGALRVTDDAYVLDQPLDTLAIPSSLHDSLMARLDRMQPVKVVAQTAACIGREFDYDLMLAVLPPADELDDALERLTSAELIFRRGIPPDASYMFKHALVRDAAYESLLKSMRQTLHGRILAALQEAEALPEILALHAREAGLTDQAIKYYRLAAMQAVARPAFTEAIAYYRQALALIDTKTQQPELLQRELELQVRLGQAMLGGVGYAAEETTATFRRAREIVDLLGDTPQRFPVYYGSW